MFNLVVGDCIFVVDDVDVFSWVIKNKLINILENLVNLIGNEVRFVIICCLDYGEIVDSFIEKLFDKWFFILEVKVN